MNKEKLEQEHAYVKERLSELTAFINSSEYYALKDSERRIIANQRIGMEMYIGNLSLRLWGNIQEYPTDPSMLYGLLWSTLMASSTPRTYSVPTSGNEES